MPIDLGDEFGDSDARLRRYLEHLGVELLCTFSEHQHFAQVGGDCVRSRSIRLVDDEHVADFEHAYLRPLSIAKFMDEHR